MSTSFCGSCIATDDDGVIRNAKPGADGGGDDDVPARLIASAK